MWIVVLLVIALAIFVYVKIRSKFKRLAPLGTITVCTGAVKTGKTTLAVHLALRSYRKEMLRWRIAKLFHREGQRPLLYSNIPLSVPYVAVTTELLLRKVRVVPKSVVLLDEASLVADSQMIKDNNINMQLLKFFKLFGHASHGGTLIIDTQSISDLHYAIKRCINQYLYIKKTYSFMPFFLCMDVVEQRYSDDGAVVAAETKDLDEITKRVILPKSVWRKFDTYCYSAMTDHLVCDISERTATTLKQKHIPSFRDWSD